MSVCVLVVLLLFFLRPPVNFCSSPPALVSNFFLVFFSNLILYHSSPPASFPPFTYRVNVDVDVPTFLPLSGQRRLADLRYTAQQEKIHRFRIDGQVRDLSDGFSNVLERGFIVFSIHFCVINVQRFEWYLLPQVLPIFSWRFSYLFTHVSDATHRWTSNLVTSLDIICPTQSPPELSGTHALRYNVLVFISYFLYCCHELILHPTN